MLLTGSRQLLAQTEIALTFPFKRMVLQRGTNNQARVEIAGNYYRPLDRIEARVVPIRAGWGTATNWQSIQEAPQKGAFLGALTLSGGWYRLEVRGVYQNNYTVIAADTMGVGEVLVIAGQSNAQGYTQPSQRDPADERVICINNYYDNGFSSDPPIPVFSKLKANSFITPFGISAWSWGPLADYLAQSLNVPVLLYNAARYSTNVKNWRESAEGIRTVNQYCSSCPNESDRYLPDGIPYGNLKVVLNQLASLTGLRAVLWHQGESDSYPANTSSESYYGDLKAIIERSRADCGRNVSWMVARVSYTPDENSAGHTWQPIIEAQNQVIANVANVFAGPNTDLINVPRAGTGIEGYVHFSGNGHYEHGKAWADLLASADFLNRSQPLAAQPLVQLQAECAGTNRVRLSAGQLPAYNWSNGTVNSIITVDGGTYLARSRNPAIGSGITVFSQPYRVPDRPMVSSSLAQTDQNGNFSYCQGTPIKFSTQYQASVSWNTGATGPVLENVTRAGEYIATFQDVLGCSYRSSTAFVKEYAPPARPVITADGNPEFCQGTVRTLTAQSASARSYFWNTGSTGSSVQASGTRWYAARVIDNNGCLSGWSDSIRTKQYATPARPVIQTNRPLINNSFFNICANETLLATASASDSTYRWSNGQTSPSVSLSVQGSYTVQAVGKGNCVSAASEAISVQVLSVPAKPIVAASGPLAFCDGNSVTLTNFGNTATGWFRNGTQIAPSAVAVARTTGEYVARVTDRNNCSNYSDKLIVTAVPLPDTPVITQEGPFTLKANARVQGNRYIWHMGTDSVITSTFFLKPPKEGVFTVQTEIRNDILPFPSFTCRSARSQPFPYLYDPTAGDFVVFPNPSSDGRIKLETKANWKNVQIEVVRPDGVVLFIGQAEVFDQQRWIELGRRPGLYVIIIKADGLRATRRVLITP